MSLGYRGAVRTCPAPLLRPSTSSPRWHWTDGRHALSLEGHGPGFRLFTWDSLALLIRGHVRVARTGGPLDLERVAQEVRGHYLDSGELPTASLEGSFTLALLDGQTGRALLYRNLAGNGFTYYHAGPQGFCFGGNLADLVDASGVEPRCNRAALPAYFLFRFVPGAETLFADFFRVLPGELVAWDGQGITRRQIERFAGPSAAEEQGTEVDRLEAVLGAVLTDCAGLEPRTATLLSGGVDSSYLQAVWNRTGRGTELLPPSFSVCVDHPRTWEDTDYAMTASQALGTRHTLVPADNPYAGYLTETLAVTGEPPNHVQTAYFLRLAHAMREHGQAAGLCGEGADSLFGISLAGRIQDAARLRRFVPRPLHGPLGRLAGWLGRRRWEEACRLAGSLDEYADPVHPVNEVARYTDLAAVEACFGRDGLERGAAYRRALLDTFAVPVEPLDRLHGAGFLGEAADSASLWTTLFNAAGLHLSCPFLDSRVVRFALELPRTVRYRTGRPKDLLKRALKRYLPEQLVERRKLGFGQPIFEWLAPGGQLATLTAGIGRYDFLDRELLARLRERPTWFLGSLLCFDLWHRLFIERSLPRERPAASGAQRAAVGC